VRYAISTEGEGERVGDFQLSDSLGCENLTYVNAVF
jgi:hypothetical protein